MGGQGGKKRVVKAKPTVAVSQSATKTKAKVQKKTKTPPEPAESAEAPPPLGGEVVESDGEEDVASTQPMQLDAKKTSEITRELRRQKPAAGSAGAASGRAVLYLGHIPHGFYEEQMRGFFSQFGTVTRLRLARNKRTSRSKHYAFIEFAHPEVAHIVAKAMNGYLMYSKVLVAKVVPSEDVHPSTFKGAKRAPRKREPVAVERKRHNQERSAEGEATHERAVLAGLRRKRRKLESLGIEYEFDIEGSVQAVAKRQKRRAQRGPEGPSSAAAE